MDTSMSICPHRRLPPCPLAFNALVQTQAERQGNQLRSRAQEQKTLGLFLAPPVGRITWLRVLGGSQQVGTRARRQVSSQGLAEVELVEKVELQQKVTCPVC